MADTKVLVAADEPQIRHTLRSLLMQDGFDVCEVEDSVAGLTTVSPDAIEAILIDLSRRWQDNFDSDAWRHLRARLATIPIIFLVHDPGAVLFHPLAFVGETIVLRKPFDLNSLLTPLHRMVEVR